MANTVAVINEYIKFTNKTHVALVNDTTSERLMVVLDGDYTNASQAVLIDAARKTKVAEWFPKLGEQLRGEKLSELDTKMSTVDAFLEKAKQEFEQIKTESAATQGTLMQLIDMIYSVVGEHDFDNNLSGAEGGDGEKESDELSD